MYVLSLGAYASFCKNHLNMDLTGYRALCNKVVTTTSGAVGAWSDATDILNSE